MRFPVLASLWRHIFWKVTSPLVDLHILSCSALTHVCNTLLTFRQTPAPVQVGAPFLARWSAVHRTSSPSILAPRYWGEQVRRGLMVFVTTLEACQPGSNPTATAFCPAVSLVLVVTVQTQRSHKIGSSNICYYILTLWVLSDWPKVC